MSTDLFDYLNWCGRELLMLISTGFSTSLVTQVLGDLGPHSTVWTDSGLQAVFVRKCRGGVSQGHCYELPRTVLCELVRSLKVTHQRKEVNTGQLKERCLWGAAEDLFWGLRVVRCGPHLNHCLPPYNLQTWVGKAI